MARRKFHLNEARAVDELIRRTERDWYRGGRVPHFAEVEDAEGLTNEYGLMVGGCIDTSQFSIRPDITMPGFGGWHFPMRQDAAPNTIEKMQANDLPNYVHAYFKKQEQKEVVEGVACRVREEKERLAEIEKRRQERLDRAIEVEKLRTKAALDDIIRMRREYEERETLHRKLMEERETLHRKLIPLAEKYGVRFIVKLEDGYLKLVAGVFPNPEEGFVRGVTLNGTMVSVSGTGESRHGWL